MSAPRVGPLVHARELDAQQGRLEAVEAVVAPDFVLALTRLSQAAQPRGQYRVAGADRTAVPERAEVLRLERECGGGADRTGTATAVPRSGRMRAVLEHDQAVPPRDVIERAHVAQLAVQVDGDDRGSARPDGRAGGVGVDQAGAVIHVA